MRYEKGPRPGSARHAREIADYISTTDGEGDGWHLAPTEAEVAEKALRSYAGRGLRRAKAVAIVCLVVLGLRDGNANGRADVFDYAAAAGVIALGSDLAAGPSR